MLLYILRYGVYLMITTLDSKFDNPYKGSYYILSNGKRFYITDETFDELKRNYYKILKSIKELIIELKINNSMEVNVLFSYLLWNGFLSKDSLLVYDCENHICLENIDGISIMTGKSKCLNNAEMLKDLQNTVGYHANTVQLYMPPKIGITYSMDLPFNSNGKKELTKKERIKKFINGIELGNHLCTIVSDDYNIYMYDPTNNWFCELINTRLAKICNSKRYMFLKNGTHGLYNHDELLEDLYRMDYDKKIKRLYDAQTEYISENTIRLCDSNIYLLHDFHDFINPNIETINKTLEKKLRD